MRLIDHSLIDYLVLGLPSIVRLVIVVDYSRRQSFAHLIDHHQSLYAFNCCSCFALNIALSNKCHHSETGCFPLALNNPFAGSFHVSVNVIHQTLIILTTGFLTCVHDRSFFLIFCMRIHIGVWHTDSEWAQHFWRGKTHKFCVCFWWASNLGYLDLESDALPVEPPHTITVGSGGTKGPLF